MDHLLFVKNTNRDRYDPEITSDSFDMDLNFIGNFNTNYNDELDKFATKYKEKKLRNSPRTAPFQDTQDRVNEEAFNDPFDQLRFQRKLHSDSKSIKTADHLLNIDFKPKHRENVFEQLKRKREESVF